MGGVFHISLKNIEIKTLAGCFFWHFFKCGNTGGRGKNRVGVFAITTPALYEPFTIVKDPDQVLACFI